MADFYPWVKALHVMAVIAWMAGLFYLPRLFVYHCKVAAGSEASELFKVMEEKLLRVIMAPAMTVAWIAGLVLIWMIGDFPGWLIVKVLAVVALSVYHTVLKKHAMLFGRDERPKDERFYRILNEVPTVLMVIIVIMVIVKPF